MSALFPVGLYLGSTALFAVTLWSYGRVVSRRDRKTAVQRFGTVLKNGLFVVGAVEFFILFEMGVHVTVAQLAIDTLGVSPASVVAALAGAMGVVLLPALSVFVCYLPAVGHLRRLRDIELSTGHAAVRMARFLGYICLVSVPGMTLFLLGPSGGTLVAATILGFLALYVGNPAIVRFNVDTEEPAGATAARLETLCERVDFAPAAIRVLQLDESEGTTITVRGIPGRRHLFVSSHLLSELEDDHLAALLALQAELARRWHFERRMGLLLGFVIVGMAGLFGLFPGTEDAGLLLAVFGMVVTCVLMWRGRTLPYRADRAAADSVGTGTLLSAFQYLVDDHDAPTAQGRLTTMIQQAPPLGARMERLEASREERAPQ